MGSLAFVAKGISRSIHRMDPAAQFRYIEAAAGRAYAQMLTKTDISAGTTFDTTWAEAAADRSASAFLDQVRPRTVVDHLEGVLRGRINSRVPAQTADVIGDWVGQGLGVPVAKLAIDELSLLPSKIGVTLAFTQELARFPENLNIIERRAINGVAQGVDRAFLDPLRTAVTNVSPASIVAGSTEVNSTGLTAAALELDIANLLAALSDGTPARPYIVINPTVALFLARLRTATGETRAFPDVTFTGGSIFGVPVLVSAQAQHYIVAIDAEGVVVAESGAEIRPSTEAMIELTDTPVGDAVTPTAGSTAYVSLFQANSAAVLVNRWITWGRRDDAAAFIDLPFGSPA